MEGVKMKCPFCGSSASVLNDNGVECIVECPLCGRFKIHYHALNLYDSF